MRFPLVFALSVFAAAASAQIDVKAGLSQGDYFGAYAGLSGRIPGRLPLRLDGDVYSSFQDFGDRSAGAMVTLNYIQPLSIKALRGAYAGIGVGYIRGVEKGDTFDTLGTKFIIGAAIPNSKFGVEGALLWAQHSIGQIHTVGTVSLVYRI